MTRKDISVLLLLVLLCAIVAVASPQFLSVANLQNVARLVGAYGIFSIGVGIVIITGGIDLSVGSVAGASSILTAVLIATDWLRSLSLREFRSGLGEVVKCGAIRDVRLLDLLEEHDPARLVGSERIEEVIARHDQAS